MGFSEIAGWLFVPRRCGRIWLPFPFHPLHYLLWEGGLHSLTLAHVLTRRLLPWPAGTQTRCRMGQMRSAGRSRLPRGRRAAGSAKGQELGSAEAQPGAWLLWSTGKGRTAPAVTHLPAPVPVCQEPEHYAEHHVAKKHHLIGIETQLWRAHSQLHGAVLLFKLWVSCVLPGQQDELWHPEPQASSFQGWLLLCRHSLLQPSKLGWMARFSK